VRIRSRSHGARRRAEKMSYTALARKWRPKNFSELVGQEHVLRALINSLTSGRVHHAFLFTGTRGVGKTTIARILAKCLNCEKGVTAEPCGQCAACREIDAGRFVDLLEVDAASRTKVDDTRELLDNVQYAPTRGRYKVYLIDEVHMLSTHSFNALLKTLEEPPPHVKFLLATTDPQKLPVTVLSRCLQFNLKRLPVSLIAERMRHILEAEGIESEPAGVRLIAQAADGSVRDGLSLLDQLIAFGGGRAGEAEARAMLGTVARDHVVQLAEHLASADAQALMHAARGLEEWAPDYAQVLEELAALLARIALRQSIADFAGDELFAPELLTRLAQSISREDVQLFYQTAILGKRDLALAPDPRTGFEMTLLRMLAFRPEVRGLEGRDSRTAPALTAATQEPPRTAPRAVAIERAAEGSSATADSTYWNAIVSQLDLTGAARQLASHCVLLGRQAGVVRLALDPERPFVRTAAQVEKLTQALTRYFGEAVRLEFESVASNAVSPAREDERASLAQLEAARASIESDAGVKTLRERFGATLLPDSVRPIK
jgi:DNA polymerase III subunit gamma/tau